MCHPVTTLGCPYLPALFSCEMWECTDHSAAILPYPSRSREASRTFVITQQLEVSSGSSVKVRIYLSPAGTLFSSIANP